MPVTNSKEIALLGKVQAAANTPVVPSPATDYIRIVNTPVVEFDQVELEDKTVARAHGQNASKVILKGMKLAVEFYMRSGGGAGIRPDHAPLWECANHNVVTTAGVKVEITPFTGANAGRKTATFYWYQDGQRYEFENAMFDGLTMDEPINGYVMVKGTIMAAYKEPTIAAVPAGIVEQQSEAIAVVSSDVVTDGGTAIAVGSFSFATSGTLSMHEKIGKNEVQMDSRDKPAVTLTKSSIGTPADLQRLQASGLLQLKSVCGAAGNRVTLTLNKGQLTTVKAAVNGINMDSEVAITARDFDNSYMIVID